MGAAKLLGKYPGSMSSSMLIGALDDQSPLVRRASMVSLSEHFLNGFPVYDRSLIEKIYSKLGDPDVEVRREVSTMIPRLVTPMMRGGVERTIVNGRWFIRLFQQVCVQTSSPLPKVHSWMKMQSFGRIY